MKKYFILALLFIMPISAYLFFATGINQFKPLPIITEGIDDLPDGNSILGQQPSLKDKITILGFPGKDLFNDRGDAFNLNQKIYNKYKDFEDFQLIMVLPKGNEVEAQRVIDELSPISDMSKWDYLFLEEQDLESFFKSLKLVGKLDADFSTPNVYIIDKSMNLRGRKGKNKKGDIEYKEGYSSVSAAELHNEMMDDVKVVLAEYRLALKKNSRLKKAEENER